MRSESTSAFGQPSETMPTLGGEGSVISMDRGDIVTAAHFS
jgi:hypothetical protein